MVKNFKFTNQIVNHISNISASNAILSTLPLPQKLEESLHQEAVVKSTHFSTKIEGNSISLEKVQTLLKGEEIIAKPKDILEVKNYKKALEFVYNYDKSLSMDLILQIHKILTKNIYDGIHSGYIREAQNAIYGSRVGVVYVPPKPQDVDTLMQELISWYQEETSLHPLIKIAIFHYEFVTIHPFMDGNGRSARVICEFLLKKESFDTRKLISLDSYYEENLDEYYAKLDNGMDFYEDRIGANLNNWIIFFLKSMDIVTNTIKEHTLKIYENRLKSSQQNSSKSSQEILKQIKLNPYITIKELSHICNLTTRAIQKNINRLKDKNLLKRIGAKKGGYWKIL